MITPAKYRSWQCTQGKKYVYPSQATIPSWVELHRPVKSNRVNLDVFTRAGVAGGRGFNAVVSVLRVSSPPPTQHCVPSGCLSGEKEREREGRGL